MLFFVLLFFAVPSHKINGYVKKKDNIVMDTNAKWLAPAVMEPIVVRQINDVFRSDADRNTIVNFGRNETRPEDIIPNQSIVLIPRTTVRKQIRIRA